MTSPFFRAAALPLALGLLAGCADGGNHDADASATAPAAEAAPAPAGAAAEGAAQPDDEAGFTPLFDGSTLDGWHLYRKPGQPVTGWAVEDGAIVRTGKSGDLMTDGDYGDFDLRFEWKISSGGNSGVFYRANEDNEESYWSGIEYQVLDDDRHPDGRNGPDRHAGAVYGMYPPEGAQPRPVGEWNQGRIVAKGDHVEHWLNGTKVAEYTLWTPEWKAKVAATKFAAWPDYGLAKTGRIGLQDHGDAVSFRNLRIRAL